MEKQKQLVLKILTELKFPHHERFNVATAPYEGFVLGQVYLRKGTASGVGHAKALSRHHKKKKYDEIYIEAKKLMKKKDPNFKFTSIQFNKNNKAKKHKDGKNVGVSYIIGLGDYTGGGLIVYDADGKKSKTHDIKNKFFKFNGSIHPHETAPFKGERYTLVFYSI
tara:strand:+ start:206 stop:703 length:498 start_codon:yes stop_codon:yes gene_type:complete